MERICTEGTAEVRPSGASTSGASSFWTDWCGWFAAYNQTLEPEEDVPVSHSLESVDPDHPACGSRTVGGSSRVPYSRHPALAGDGTDAGGSKIEGNRCGCAQAAGRDHYSDHALRNRMVNQKRLISVFPVEETKLLLRYRQLAPETLLQSRTRPAQRSCVDDW